MSRSPLLLAVLLAACGGGGAVPSPTPTPEVSGDPCARAAGRDWTTERGYARRVVPRGASIELGLGGRPDATVRATVHAPGGSETSATKVQEQRRGGSVASYVVRFPRDFAGEGVVGGLGVATPGAYAVRWEANGAVVACDTFEVSKLGVGDAQSCAPAGWSATAPFGGPLLMRSGGATISIAPDPRLLGIASDPWYAFEPVDRQPLALADGSSVTIIVDRRTPPRRVAAPFSAGSVPYRLDATGEGVPDLVDRTRAVVACAYDKLR